MRSLTEQYSISTVNDVGKAALQVGRFLIGLAFLAGSVLGLAVGFRYLVHYLFRGVSPTVAAAIVAATATGLVSILTIVLQRRYERRHSIDQEIRQRKVEVYTDLLTHFFEIFGLGEERSDDESDQAISGATAMLAKLTPSLIAWASDDVLLAWSRYRRRSTTVDPVQNIFGFEEVLLAIRLDLGHKNKGFAQRDLLALWINDIDDVTVAVAPDNSLSS